MNIATEFIEVKPKVETKPTYLKDLFSSSEEVKETKKMQILRKTITYGVPLGLLAGGLGLIGFLIFLLVVQRATTTDTTEDILKKIKIAGEKWDKLPQELKDKMENLYKGEWKDLSKEEQERITKIEDEFYDKYLDPEKP